MISLLTSRHQEIVQLIGRDGLTYLRAAKKLGISQHTLRAHIRVICDRLGKPRLINPRAFVVLLAEEQDRAD